MSVYTQYTVHSKRAAVYLNKNRNSKTDQNYAKNIA